MRKGSKASLETRAKISQAAKRRWRDPEHRAKMSKALKRRWRQPGAKAKMIRAAKRRMKQPGAKAKVSRAATRAWECSEVRANHGRATARPEYRAKLSRALKGHKHSPETIMKMSKAKILAIKEGRSHPGRYGTNGEFYSKKNGRTFHYRSQLELGHYQLLEKMSKVEKYRVEPFPIPYKWKGAVHHYLPDLQVRYTDGTEELIEVKPEGEYFRDPINQAKWKAARRWCEQRKRSTKFKVVGYEELN